MEYKGTLMSVDSYMNLQARFPERAHAIRFLSPTSLCERRELECWIRQHTIHECVENVRSKKDSWWLGTEQTTDVGPVAVQIGAKTTAPLPLSQKRRRVFSLRRYIARCQKVPCRNV